MVACAGEAFLAKRTWPTNRLKQRALDRELPWTMIPDDEKPLFREAAGLQWKQWQEYDAIEVLDIGTSKHLKQQMGHRILRSRFVYRNKNAGIPGAACKPKARLCVGGHNDPDLQVGLRTDAPTVSRNSLLVFLVVAAAFDMEVVAGDIECALMQGVAHERPDELLMAQPREGLEGLHPEQLVRVKECSG